MDLLSDSMDRRVLLLLTVMVSLVRANIATQARERLRRQPTQKDEATEEATNRVDISKY